MPRINLLPWREELRKDRQRNMLVAAGSALVLGLATTLGANWAVNQRIDHQQARNQYMKDEIKLLDAAITEISELESIKSRRLARMEIIEQLQASRPRIVHLFDELVGTLPDGVFLTSIKQSGERLEIRGVAQSSTRISAFMRNIDSSDWLTNPDLSVVQTIEDDRSRYSTFTVFARQASPSTDAEG